PDLAASGCRPDGSTACTSSLPPLDWISELGQTAPPEIDTVSENVPQPRRGSAPPRDTRGRAARQQASLEASHAELSIHADPICPTVVHLKQRGDDDSATCCDREAQPPDAQAGVPLHPQGARLRTWPAQRVLRPHAVRVQRLLRQGRKARQEAQ